MLYLAITPNTTDENVYSIQTKKENNLPRETNKSIERTNNFM